MNKVYDLTSTNNTMSLVITRDIAQQYVENYKMSTNKKVNKLYKKITRKIIKYAKNGKTNCHVYIGKSTILESLRFRFQSQGFKCLGDNIASCLWLDWS